MAEKILLVDDDTHLLAALRRTLRRQFDMSTAVSPTDAFRQMADDRFAVIVSDLRMPDMDGIAFLTQVRERSPDSTRILLTGHADLQAAIDAVNESQIFRLLTKPVPANVIETALRAGLEQHRLVMAKQELDLLKSRFNLDVVYKLRTLLARFNMYLYMLERGKPQKQRAYLEKLKQENVKLTQLANNMLAVSYLELASNPADFVLLDMNTVVEEAIKTCAEYAESVSSTLQTTLASDLLPVRGEQGQLQLVVISLITDVFSDAVASSIQIDTYNTPDKVNLCITVSDPKIASRLFTYERQKRMAQLHTLNGGMGLKIVGEIVARHGGGIEMDGDAASTTVIRLWFPAASAGVAEGVS